MQGTRWAGLVGGVVLLVLLTAQPAQAVVRVEMSGTRLLVTEDEGERATFIVEHFADCCRNGIRVRERGLPQFETAISSQDSDCLTNAAFNDVVCQPFPSEGSVSTGNGDDIIDIGGSNSGCVAVSGTGFTVTLGGGDDQLSARFACGGSAGPAGINRLHPRFLSASASFGNDDLTGGRLNDSLLGESGFDLLVGAGGDDTLDGGNDRDTVSGGSGEDTLQGGFGNDTLDGGTGADTIDGGSQNVNGDTVTYATRSAPVTLALAAPTSTGNGAADENDTLVSIENAVGGGGADDITGTVFENDIEGRGGDDVLKGLDGDDLLEGGDGNDTLEGGDEGDRLEGGGGTDILKGGAGNDDINSRDGIREIVDCGSDTDTAVADSEDTFVRSGGRTGPFNCENIQQSPVDDGLPGTILGRSVRIRRSGGLKLRFRCPRRARVTCKGRLRLKHVGKHRTLASGRYKVRRGKTKTLRLRLSRRAARRARARLAIVVRTREPGVSKKRRFRGSIVTLRVRR